ncbi:MAG: nucleotidyltransferase domain-containing protein [Eubacteriales bacterium]|nr:nucleotidyltransferase domain-containing protein [Eubacteriales bacterium]
MSELVIENYEQICSIFDKYGVSNARIFGSVARMEDKETSDLDLLVDMPPNGTLIQFGQLQYELWQLLQKPIDLITFSCLKPTVLEHFKKISIDFYRIKALSKDNAPKESMTKADRIIKNGNSVIWVIDRILNSCQGVNEELFLLDSTIQDAVTRNIQLLGQVMSQFPNGEWIGDKDAFFQAQHGCVMLRDALFMNVDITLLWHTVTKELPALRKMVSEGLAAI